MLDFFAIYNSFYLILVGLYLFLLLLLNSNKVISSKFSNSLIIIISIFFIVLFGSRSLEIGADTAQYFLYYKDFIQGDLKLLDPGFTILISLSSLLGSEGYFFMLAAFFMVPLCVVFIRIESKYKIFVFILFLTQFSFLSMGINILRQGVGISFFILASYFYFFKYAKTKALLLFVFAISLHLSLILYLPMYILARRIGLRTGVIILIIAIVISCLPFNLLDTLSSLPLVGRRMDSYLNSDNSIGYRVGFRLDFLLYNSYYILLGLYLVYKGKGVIKCFLYQESLILYILLTAVFVLTFKVPYSDRFGVLSWVLIPIIVFPVFYLPKNTRILLLFSFIIINTLLSFRL